MKGFGVILTAGLLLLGTGRIWAESTDYGYERPRVSEPKLAVQGRIQSIRESGRDYTITVKFSDGSVQEIRANQSKFQDGDGQNFDPKNVQVGNNVSVHYTQAKSSQLESVRNRDVSRIFVYGSR